MKIVDCFIFYNELELLDYRLNVLDTVVDYFVLVEAETTFTNNKKELFYLNNKDYFQKFESKIIHIVVKDSISSDPWENERYQRNCIAYGLLQISLTSNDIIILSDLDEIPNPHTLDLLKDDFVFGNIYSLEQDFYYYSLNNKMKEYWYYSKIMEYSKYIECKNKGISIDSIRWNNYNFIRNGGWHLSYFGTPEFISNKIKNFSHQEFNIPEFNTPELIAKRIENSVDLFSRNEVSLTKLEIHENTNLPPLWLYLTQFQYIHVPELRKSKNPLIKLVNNVRTDKNTIHSFLELYHSLFNEIRDSVKKVLEIGICYGGSIKLWNDYFPNAEIHGMDIIGPESIWKEIFGKEKIILHIGVDSYTETVVNTLPMDFDIIIDDGPHTLESMISVVNLYIPLLAVNGMLIIEDIQDINWVNEIIKHVPKKLIDHITLHDLRDKKGRYDDIVLVIRNIQVIEVIGNEELGNEEMVNQVIGNEEIVTESSDGTLLFGFHASGHMCERGTTIAMYDYAYYIQNINGYKNTQK